MKRSVWLPILCLMAACLCEAVINPNVGPQSQPTPGSFRYIAGGDSRDDRSHVMPWALAEAKARGASAFFFLGDMELTPQLDAKFQRELALLDPVPFYPVLGNHEVELFGFISIGKRGAERAFRQHFLGNARTPVMSSLPDRVVYSVNLPGGVHFVALDNVTAEGFGADQLTWLENDLARTRPAAKYIFVGMHRPLAYNGITTHGMDQDSPQDRAESNAALQLFVRFKVDLILMSHEHEFAELRQSGVRSFLTGGLGAPLALTATGFHHFLQIDVSPSGLNVQVVKFGGTPSVEAIEGEGHGE